MAILNFISDQYLERHVRELLTVAIHARKMADDRFERNVIDPFAALFELSGFRTSEQTWLDSERNRQAQKSLQNAIGVFHQNILGSITDWQNLSTGAVIDVVNHKQHVIAEIKNKHNTLNAAGKTKLYEQLENLVMPKGQQYKGFTAYYVEIIPKSPQPYDVPFTPSDASKGCRKAENPLIRQIDGYSFYALVTGVDDALAQLFSTLPAIIESQSDYRFTDKQFAAAFFQRAYRPD